MKITQILKRTRDLKHTTAPQSQRNIYNKKPTSSSGLLKAVHDGVGEESGMMIENNSLSKFSLLIEICADICSVQPWLQIPIKWYYHRVVLSFSHRTAGGDRQHTVSVIDLNPCCLQVLRALEYYHVVRYCKVFCMEYYFICSFSYIQLQKK